MYTPKVEKMSCGGCAARVTRAVKALNPDAKVEVLLKDRLVHAGSREAPAAVADAITNAGYPASEVVKA